MSNDEEDDTSVAVIFAASLLDSKGSPLSVVKGVVAATDAFNDADDEDDADNVDLTDNNIYLAGDVSDETVIVGEANDDIVVVPERAAVFVGVVIVAIISSLPAKGAILMGVMHLDIRKGESLMTLLLLVACVAGLVGVASAAVDIE